jgi:YbbR domain-containing protein
MKVARAITNNFGAKVLALIVALLVWFNASGQEEVARVRTVPLVLEGLPDSLAAASAVPATADLRITTTRRHFVALGFQRLTVVADLTGLAAGHQRVPLSGDQVRGIGNLAVGRVTVLAPAVLEVDLEPLSARRLQVSLATTGALPSNVIMLDGGVSIEPAWVTVRGPASALEGVQHVSTAPVDVSRVRETTTRAVRLEWDPSAFACDPEEVTVTFRVSPRGERVLANVPPTVLLDSDAVDAEVDPDAVTLTLEGPAAILDTLSSGDVSVLVVLGERGPASYRMVPEIILPAGVRLTAISADTLDVHVYRTRP